MLIAHSLLIVAFFWLLALYLNLREERRLLREDISATKHVISWLETLLVDSTIRLPNKERNEEIERINAVLVAQNDHPSNHFRVKSDRFTEDMAIALIDDDIERKREQNRVRVRRNKPANKNEILLGDSLLHVQNCIQRMIKDE